MVTRKQSRIRKASSKDVRSMKFGGVIDATISLESKGVSVVHGTLLVDGRIRSFKHQLTGPQKDHLSECLLAYVIFPNAGLGKARGS